jgi:hypothetical protein
LPAIVLPAPSVEFYRLDGAYHQSQAAGAIKRPEVFRFLDNHCHILHKNHTHSNANNRRVAGKLILLYSR